MHLSRRQLLRSGAASLALATPATSLAPHLGAPVTLGQHADPDIALEQALAPLKPFAGVRPGDRVLIKVNTNSGDPYPFSSRPGAVAWLTRRLRELGAQVTVGDRSFWGDGDTAGNFRDNGIAQAAADAGAELVVFEGPRSEWVPVELPEWTGPVHLPRAAVEADLLINLASAKTHFITHATLSLKNLLGLVRSHDRARPGNLRTHHPERIFHQIAWLNTAITPHLNILDAHQALVAGGPTPRDGHAPQLARTEMVLASRDRVALDAAGIALLQKHAPRDEALHGYAPWKHPMILAAQQAGLGG